jgi:hypothetical protein
MEGFGKKLCFAIMQFLQKSVWCAIFHILLVTPIELLRAQKLEKNSDEFWSPRKIRFCCSNFLSDFLFCFIN